MHAIIIILCLLFAFFGCRQEPETRAPLFKELGEINHFKITTDSELTQKYFDQGVTLAYGFNHEEAFRSFEEAARLDSSCAMAYWGMAIVLGPNINLPMDQASVSTAYEAAQKAINLLDNETKKEKDWIAALSRRYSKEKLENRSNLDSAYADAMRKLAEKYPDDPDINTMFAESIMDLHPWDYWIKSGKAQPWTPEILSTLEKVLKINENHIGANHLYIHAVEASKNPAIGLTAADRLRFLVPGAGHLVHMPAHIYIRTGKYHEGSLANQRAVKSDEEYINQCNQQGFYPLAYYPHNYHFLWATATLEGDSKTAIDAALKTSTRPPDSLMDLCGYKTLQHYSVIPLFAYVTFGKWDEILKYKAPEEARPYPQGVWHYARGMAFLGKNILIDAEKELSALENLKDNSEADKLDIWGINSAGALLKIGYEVLAGELAAKRKQYNLSVAHLKKAVEMEDKLRYDEPPTWFYPVRQNLGAVLMETGRFSEAQEVYEENLKEIPDNGWALFGLHQTLLKQNKKEEAAEAEKKFSNAWQYADIDLTASRIL